MDIFQQQDFLTFLQMLICSNIKIDRLWILCCWREHREAQLKKDLEFCPVLQKQLPLEDSLGISSRNPPSWLHVTPSGVHRWEEMSAGGKNLSCSNLGQKPSFRGPYDMWTGEKMLLNRWNKSFHLSCGFNFSSGTFSLNNWTIWEVAHWGGTTLNWS